MDDEIHHLRKTNTVLKISLVMLGVLVLLGVIQAVTAGTVGVGALSVNLRDSTSQTSLPTSTTHVAEGGLNGAVSPSPTSSTSDGAATPSAETKVVTGSFKQSRGLLTIEVTKVENQGGRIRLFITAVNASTAKMDLPLPPFVALDDQKREYGASLATSKWPVSVGKSSSISGTIDLDGKILNDAKTFEISFNSIAGQLAPTGGSVAVPGIEVPR
jgi:hypothetical protein